MQDFWIADETNVVTMLNLGNGSVGSTAHWSIAKRNGLKLSQLGVLKIMRKVDNSRKMFNSIRSQSSNKKPKCSQHSTRICL